jgi:hypothetical protein
MNQHFYYMLCQERTICENVWKKLQLDVMNGSPWAIASNRTSEIATIQEGNIIASRTKKKFLTTLS